MEELIDQLMMIYAVEVKDGVVRIKYLPAFDAKERQILKSDIQKVLTQLHISTPPNHVLEYYV